MERTVHGMYRSGGQPSVLVEVVRYGDDEWYVEESGKAETRRRPVYKIETDTAKRLLDQYATVREP